MRVAILLIAVVCASVLAACGDSSDAESATTTICAARDDIAKEVDSLGKLTVSTATVDAISTSIDAIGDDLEEIRGAWDDLSDDRRAQIEQANEQFADEVRDVAGEVGASLSLSTARERIEQGLAQLGDTYRSTLARIDCSS